MFVTKLDADLLVFLATIGTILTSSYPRLRKSSVPIPADYDFQEVLPDALTEKQKKFLEPLDRKMAALNYQAVLTYRVRNYGMNLLRRYINPADPASCTIIIVEVKVGVGSTETVSQGSVLNFMTEFTDGKSLTTRNMKLKSVLDQPPEFLVQDCPQVDDPATLKKRHDDRARSLGTPVSAPADAAHVFALYQKQHHRFSDYQVERGTFSRTNTGYAVTNKSFLRGIRNFLVPFAQRLSLYRLLLAAISAILIPSATCIKILPVAFTLARKFGLPPAATLTLLLIASYIVAGAIVGFLLETNAFLWAFLLTYIGVHIVSGWWPSVVPYGAIAGLAAHYATQFRNRQRVMLAPSTVPVGVRRI